MGAAIRTKGRWGTPEGKEALQAGIRAAEPAGEKAQRAAGQRGRLDPPPGGRGEQGRGSASS